jgi:hypothetical protein
VLRRSLSPKNRKSIKLDASARLCYALIFLSFQKLSNNAFLLALAFAVRQA